MKIAILEMGVLSDDLAARHGSFFDLIQVWLLRGQRGTDVSFSQYTICQGDAFPEPNAFDAYVISGSKHAVYDDLPWIVASKAFLHQVKAANIPMFGICFGHQLMAEAFGGKVSKSEKGWGLGVDDYDVDGTKQEVLVFHQDQVVEKPEGAEVMAQSAHCEYGVLKYDFPAFSTQFHPEFTQALVQDLIARDPQAYGEALSQRASVKTEQASLNNDAIASQVLSFFETGEVLVLATSD